MYRLPLLSIALAILACSFTTEATARKWTDNTGNFSVDADFVKLEGGNVHLKRTDTGKTIVVPLTRLNKGDQQAATDLAQNAKKPPQAARNDGSIDAPTFMKAFADGNANEFKGKLIIAGGAVPESTSNSEGAQATLIICGKRPDGEIYDVKKESGNTYNFDARKDRLFAVRLVFQKGNLPKGYEAGSAKFVLGMSDLCERFVGRFDGDLVEVSISQSGQADRKERVPVLVWHSNPADEPNDE